MTFCNPKFVCALATALIIFAGLIPTDCIAQSNQNGIPSSPTYYARPDQRAVNAEAGQLNYAANQQAQPAQPFSRKSYVDRNYLELLNSKKSTKPNIDTSYLNATPQTTDSNKVPNDLVPPGGRSASEFMRNFDTPGRSNSIEQYRPPSSPSNMGPMAANGSQPKKTISLAPPPSFRSQTFSQTANQPQQATITLAANYSPAVANGQTQTQMHPHTQTQPQAATGNQHTTYQQQIYQQPVAATSQNHAQQQSNLPPIIQGSSSIPTGFDSGPQAVTQARILMTQQGGDPFGQVPDDEDFEKRPAQRDPFADPELNNNATNQRQDPFADPPSDLNGQQRRDPFADPPQDRPNRQDPFGDRPNPIKEVDPFPNTPQNIRPNTEFNPPADTLQVEPQNINPGIAPGESPNRDQNEPELILGPYESKNGFAPTPLNPAPARREFATDIMHVAPPVILSNQPQFGFDQPSLFGPEFDKSNLYEGITHQPLATPRQYGQPGYATASRFARPRLLDNIGRNLPGLQRCAAGDCGYGLANSPCEYDYIDGGCSDCDLGFVDDCCEPMFYFSVFGGYTQLESAGPLGDNGIVAGFGRSDTVNFSDGYGVGLAIGQIQGRNLRTEIEFVFRDNDVDSIYRESGGPNGNETIPANGSAATFSGMFNCIWDFGPRYSYRCYQPYAGAGIGFSFLDFDLNSNGNGSESSFAYQFIAGVSRPISCQTDAFVEYRYFNANSFNNRMTQFATGELDYQTDNVFFGFRMHF